jgi:hypothetical protein
VLTFLAVISFGRLFRATEADTLGELSQPNWQFDLRTVGYTGFSAKGEQWDLHFKIDPVSFTSDNLVVVTFLTRIYTDELRRRAAPNESPFMLNAVFLDAATGQVRSTKQWPIRRPRAGIISSSDGRFLVVSWDRMSVYSTDFKLLHEFTVPLTFDGAAINAWEFYPSPSGRSFVLELDQDKIAQYEWFTLDLAPVLHWADLFYRVRAISDTDLATVVGNPPPLSNEVYIGHLRDPLRLLCRSCGIPQFLDNETIALLQAHEIKLLRTDGTFLSAIALKNDEWMAGRYYPLRPAATSTRFAFAVWAHKGGSAFFDTSSHSVPEKVLVVDTLKQDAICAINASKQHIASLEGLGLSSDGSLVATLSDGIVRVWRIPKGP